MVGKETQKVGPSRPTTLAERQVAEFASILGKRDCLQALRRICQPLPKRVIPDEIERYWPTLTDEERICLGLPSLASALDYYVDMQIPTVSCASLLEEGLVILITAVKKWTPANEDSKHPPFKRYVFTNVHTGLEQFISRRHGLSRDDFPVVSLYWQCWNRFCAEQDRSPTLNEMSHLMESTKPLKMRLELCGGEDDEKSKVNIIYSASRQMPTTPQEMSRDVTYEAVEQKALQAALLQSLKFLKPREHDVVRLRWGLDEGSKPMTLRQIGEILGITEAAVERIEKGALEKLKHPFRSKYLRSFLYLE